MKEAERRAKHPRPLVEIARAILGDLTDGWIANESVRAAHHRRCLEAELRAALEREQKA